MNSPVPRSPLPVPLSAAALRLLTVLRNQQAHCPATAITHAQSAHLAGLPVRNVVDHAAELLRAGYLVCATCKKPFGIFLVQPGGALSAARVYYHSLRRRGVEILLRARSVKQALTLTESGRAPHAGPMPLWQEQPQIAQITPIQKEGAGHAV